MDNWKIYRGTNEPHDGIERLPAPPPWRDFASPRDRGCTFLAPARAIEVVNAALYLRRPLLVTGPPGSGKSSLAYAIAQELRLGKVLPWAISSRSTLGEGLYLYDGLARLRDANLDKNESRHNTGRYLRLGRRFGRRSRHDIGRYLRLGPLGTALLPTARPRVLLIDEIDKSDIDLPNDLLHIFEEGAYEIPELVRTADTSPEVLVLPSDGVADPDRVPIRGGKVRCSAFPFVVLTSNGERDLPPPFLRRCLRLDIPVPDLDELRRIVQSHLRGIDLGPLEQLLATYVEKRDSGQVLATDQLLNAIFLVNQGQMSDDRERRDVLDVLLRELGGE